MEKRTKIAKGQKNTETMVFQYNFAYMLYSFHKYLSVKYVPRLGRG